MIFLVVYKFGHHYSASGYQRLGDYLRCRRITVPFFWRWYVRMTATPEKREALKSKTGLSGYFPDSVWLETCVGMLARVPARSVFHFIYPENSYFFSSRGNTPRRARFVGTYHQPVAESRQFIRNTDAIRRLDAVILLSETQREFFEPLVGPERITVIPHGVDTEYFSPPLQPSSEKRIVAVGNWLRDFPLLAGTLRILLRADPEIVCDVVTLESNRTYFSHLSNVRFHSGITDLQLRGIYHHAACAILPLTGAGANNALLEALATGLPVIATDLPAIREYTDARGCRYVPPADPQIFADAIVALCNDPAGRKLMGTLNRERSLRYAWPGIASQTMNLYRRITES